MKDRTTHILIALAIVLGVLSAGSFFFWSNVFQQKATQTVVVVKEAVRSAREVLDVRPRQEPVVLIFVGDIMLDRGVEWQIKQNKKEDKVDWSWPFQKVIGTLRQADIVFGNLESQISDKGTNVGSIYSFRADPDSIQGLSHAGFDVVSVANNHSFDYTKEAFKDSLDRLKKAGIAYIGGGFSKEEAHTPVIKEIRGTKVGYLAYSVFGAPSWKATANQPGISWLNPDTLEELKEDIKKVRPLVDILAVSVHAGEEYEKTPNSFQKTFAQTAINEGADLVIGHHPHVVQPVKRYRNGWIAYSLGNFVFDQKFSSETMQASILQVVVSDKKISGVSVLKTILNPFLQVELAQ